jgi:hypothetical protein
MWFLFFGRPLPRLNNRPALSFIKPTSRLKLHKSI